MSSISQSVCLPVPIQLITFPQAASGFKLRSNVTNVCVFVLTLLWVQAKNCHLDHGVLQKRVQEPTLGAAGSHKHHQFIMPWGETLDPYKYLVLLLLSNDKCTLLTCFMSASQFILHIDDTRCISGIFKETRKFKITTNKCLIIEMYYMSGIYTEPGITWTSDVLYCWNCWKKNHWRKTALGSALVCVRGAPLFLTPGSQSVKYV